MNLDVLLLPSDLSPAHFAGRAVAVFDVLRATTTMTVALARCVREIRIFEDLDSARAAAEAARPRPLLVGETNCLPPPGFDLGNSPVAMADPAWADRLGGQTLFMSTTNGTRAIVAASSASLLLAGSLVNAATVAHALAGASLDITLLCAGTNGQPAMEDLIGAGAVIHELIKINHLHFGSDLALMAHRVFVASRHDLPAILATTAGGKNLIAAGLAPDIEFASRLNSYEILGQIYLNPLRVVRG